MGTEISAYVREMHFLNLLYTRQEVLHSEVGLEIAAALKNKLKKKGKGNFNERNKQCYCKFKI